MAHPWRHYKPYGATVAPYLISRRPTFGRPEQTDPADYQPALLLDDLPLPDHGAGGGRAGDEAGDDQAAAAELPVEGSNLGLRSQSPASMPTGPTGIVG